MSSERIEEVLTTPKSRHGREVRSEVRSGHMEQVAVHLSDCQKWYFWTENVKKVGGGDPRYSKLQYSVLPFLPR